jgi:hypothetical protein
MNDNFEHIPPIKPEKKEQTESYKLEEPSKPSWWNSPWNPFRTVTVDKMDNHSLGMKLFHTFYIFFGGSLSEGNLYQAGLLDWLPFCTVPKLLYGAGDSLAGICRWSYYIDEKPPPSYPSWLLRIATGIGVLLWVLGALLLIVQAALALALTIAVSPIVVIVHIFRGPDQIKDENGRISSITPARQSFWFNPSTWTTGAVIVLVISSLIQGVNPEVFGFAASALGVIQGVFVGMATLLLTLAAVKFVIEIGSVISQRSTQNLNDNTEKTSVPLVNSNSAPRNFEGQKLLSYMEDRWEWMKHHRKASISIGFFTGLALLFATSVTIAFFAGVPANSFVSLIFDHLIQMLVSLIQAMSQLPGLGFLAGSDAVLIPIAKGLAAALLIVAPVVLGDSILRFFYKRETLVEDKSIDNDDMDFLVPITYKLTERKEGSAVRNGFSTTFYQTNELSIFTVPSEESINKCGKTK